MIRILHAADLHLDSPFNALSEEKAALRRREQRELLRSLARIRAEQNASLVLLSGDLFDSDSTWAETEELLRLTLSEMAVPVFIAPGNHDYYAANGRWARMRLPENVHVFTSADFDAVVLEELNVRVWGAAFTDNYSDAKLDTLRIPRQDGFTELVCVHGEVGNPGSRYDPIDERDIAASGADYIALGHVHACSGLKKAGKTYYAWPGCPEGRGFDECGEKGVLIVDVSPGKAKAKFIPTAARRYECLSVPADELDGFRLPDGAAENIYQITITGETDRRARPGRAPPPAGAARIRAAAARRDQAAHRRVGARWRGLAQGRVPAYAARAVRLRAHRRRARADHPRGALGTGGARRQRGG